MRTIARLIIDHDYFLRRRDLLALGCTDAQLREALARGQIFRVRHGWYSVPSAPDAAVQAVRIGGRLTARSALASYGVPVPHPPRLEIAVAAGACRLRNPSNRRARLPMPAPPDAPARMLAGRGADRPRPADGRPDIRWTERPWMKHRGSPWRVTVGEALLAVLRTEGRDIATACCDLVIKAGALTAAQVDAVFDRAPKRARRWRPLVDGRSGSHGETFVRLWLADAGIRMEPQPWVDDAGHLDGQVGRWTYLEIDGAQHDEASGDGRQFELDRVRDTAVAIAGARTLHFSYRQIHRQWGRCLAAVRRSIALDNEREASERRVARLRKRRNSAIRAG